MPLISLLNPPLGLTGLTTGFNGLTIPLIPIDRFKSLTTIATEDGWEIAMHNKLRTQCGTKFSDIISDANFSHCSIQNS